MPMLTAHLQVSRVAGHSEVWDFLSENSEAYGPASEVGFFKGLVRDANTSVRRAVGDMVDEIDTTRRKIISVVPTVNLPEAPWASRGVAAAPQEQPKRTGSFSSIGSLAGRQGSQVGLQSPQLHACVLVYASLHSYVFTWACICSYAFASET